MPILFGFAGIILVVAGVRNRIISGNPSLSSLLKDDFSGAVPFWKWLLAILLIGAIGYIPNLAPISRAFMALVIVVFLLSNKGFFAELQKALSTNQPSQVTVNQNPNSPIGLSPITGATFGL